MFSWQQQGEEWGRLKGCGNLSDEEIYCVKMEKGELVVMELNFEVEIAMRTNFFFFLTLFLNPLVVFLNFA
jgi:hypothetical protein